MLLSSAYRANRSSRRSNSRSNSSSTMLLSKGDKGPPWGVPSSTGLTSQPAFHHTCSQKRPNQLQQALVADSLGDLSHQLVMINPVKEFFQVQVHHEPITFGDVLLCLFHRLMR